MAYTRRLLPQKESLDYCFLDSCSQHYDTLSRYSLLLSCDEFEIELSWGSCESVESSALCSNDSEELILD